jgi:hypothetical protein
VLAASVLLIVAITLVFCPGVIGQGVAMQRAGASVARIDAALVEAQRCGLMKFFNSRRVAANIAKLPDLLLGALPQACRGTIR